MLRASAEANGETIDLRGVGHVTVDSGVPGDAELSALTDAVVLRDPVELDAAVTRATERLGAASTVRAIAVAGNFKRGLAVDSMIRAVAGLPEHVHLAFVGANYGEWESAARVHFLPPVAPTEVVPLLAEADLAAVPYFPSSVSVGVTDRASKAVTLLNSPVPTSFDWMSAVQGTSSAP